MSKKLAVGFDLVEPASIKVGRFLISKGLFIADEHGTPCPLVGTDVVGVLRQVEPRKFLFGLVRLRMTGKNFLGKIIFLEGDMWTFEVYGREHLELAQTLSHEMSTTYGTRISIRLMSEEQKFETFRPDL